jgi:uncharacterized membrane protein
MQGINVEVRSVPFAVIFFGPLPLLIASAVAAVRRRGMAALLLAAALLYGFGLLGVTFVGNVPLNEMLATRLDPADAAAARLAYEEPWNRLNAIRTGCVLAAYVLVVFIAPLVRSRAAAPSATRTDRRGAASGVGGVRSVDSAHL